MLRTLQGEAAALGQETAARAKAEDVARRLLTVPGIGPLIAIAIEALAPHPDVSVGTGLRRVGGPHAGSKADRRQRQVGENLVHGRTHVPAIDHCGQRRRRALGQA